MSDTAERSRAGTARFLSARRTLVDDPQIDPGGRRAALADLADGWLAGLLAEAQRLVPASAAPDRVALVAVGGYGRREVLPRSDLDLVLLHDGGSVAALAEAVLYPVWDAGVDLDHAVRTPAQARAVAAEDLRVALGLLDARHVAGDAGLTGALREAVVADWRAAARRRLPELAELCRERHASCGDLAHLLEPDLVSARGGLRDTLVLRAVEASWVAAPPHAGLTQARAELLAVRDALHRCSARSGDRLVLASQDDVAATFGVLDADALLRVVSRAGRLVAYAGDATWREVERSLLPRGRPEDVQRRPLGDGVVLHNGEAVLARQARPDLDPVLPLRAAAAAASAGVPLSPHAVAVMAAQCPGLPSPWPTAARDALLVLLGAGRPAIGVWEALESAELVSRWLPDWERVRFRPQRNAVHRHTVDRHGLEAAVEASRLTREVSRPDLLLLAALLHDLGKGWPGDHCVTGAVIAADAGRRMGLPEEDVQVLGRLVRLHLLLPEAATRRDLDDPATVAAVAEAVGDRAVLDLLLALTEADAVAAGPRAWTPWRASLVRDLAARVRAVLAAPAPLAAAPDPDLDRLLADRDRHQMPVVQVEQPRSAAGSVRVLLATPDRADLLALTAGVLLLARLDVRSARIRVADGVCVQDWRTEAPFGSPPPAAALAERLRRALDGRLDVAAAVEARASSWRPPPVPVAPPRVEVLEGASSRAAVLQVRAHDRPGLLHRVAVAVAAAGAFVRAAVVDTLGAEAVDVLYLVAPDGSPLPRPAALDVAAAVAAALAGSPSRGVAARSAS